MLNATSNAKGKNEEKRNSFVWKKEKKIRIYFSFSFAPHSKRFNLNVKTIQKGLFHWTNPMLEWIKATNGELYKITLRAPLSVDEEIKGIINKYYK